MKQELYKEATELLMRAQSLLTEAYSAHIKAISMQNSEKGAMAKQPKTSVL